MKGFSQKKESARLEKLRGFEILDTPPEPVFNRLVRLTARMFGVKMAAVSLVDEYRRWFKATCGLVGPRESFRDVSFCGRAILSDGVFVVRDARKDPAWADFPLVTGRDKVRFYAGAPLVTPDGWQVGALCIMSRETRTFTKAEAQTLEDLASTVMDAIIMRQAAGTARASETARKSDQRTLVRQQRLLQKLSGTFENNIRERTAELTRANDALNAEIARREQLERDRFNLLRLVEESPDLIGLGTLEQVPIYLNEAGCLLLGLDSQESALRMPFMDYFLPEDRAYVSDTIWPALEKNGCWEGDFRFRHFQSGTAVPVSMNVFQVRDPISGKPTCIAAIARDIAERLRADAALRESEERFRHLIEQAGEAFFVCDLDGYIVDVNQEACESLGYRREELFGMPITVVETTFDPAEALPRWRAWKPGEAASTRGVHRRKDGTTFPVEARVSSIQTDGSCYVLALVRDMTDRHRAEAALELAKEVAEKANRAKSEFLSRMSHELRTPLNAILGFGQILHAQVPDAAQKDCAGHVVTAGNHLLDLINEVLDIARIEAGKVELSVEPVRVENLVAETIDLIRPLAEERRIGIAIDLSGCGGLFLLADRQRSKQVLLNLLSNAVKYSPEEAQVRIECRSLRSRELRIAVTDHGPGIAPEKLSRLFLPFDRLGAEHSKVEGTGLGLTLSKHLVEAMGGSIGVKSVPRVGSTFWLQLPRHRGVVRAGLAPLMPLLSVRLGEGEAVRANEPVPAGCTVLYIEDNTSNQRLIEHLFAHLPGVQLLTARSGKEGLAMARRYRPGLVLLDLHLPDLPGWEVLSRLRAGRATAHIPVVAVSADATPDTVGRLVKAGARAYLTKPLNIESFYELLPSLGLGARIVPDNPTLN